MDAGQSDVSRRVDGPLVVWQGDRKVAHRLSGGVSGFDRAAVHEGLNAITKLERRRENKATGEASHQSAYYIVSNAEATAAQVSTLLKTAPTPGKKKAKVRIAARRRYCLMSTACREAALRLQPGESSS